MPSSPSPGQSALGVKVTSLIDLVLELNTVSIIGLFTEFCKRRANSQCSGIQMKVVIDIIHQQYLDNAHYLFRVHERQYVSIQCQYEVLDRFQTTRLTRALRADLGHLKPNFVCFKCIRVPHIFTKQIQESRVIHNSANEP